MKVEIVAADGTTWSGNATYVRVPGQRGHIGILPGHQPMLVALTDGTARVVPDQHPEFEIPVGRGYAFVTARNIAVLPLGHSGGNALDWLSSFPGVIRR
ncbi:MAG: hypothetical protein R2722_08305 [Tessaracoccus sp.]